MFDDRFDSDSHNDYDFFYEENIFKNGADISRKSSFSSASFLGGLLYMVLVGIGLFFAVLFPPVGALIILAGCVLRDKL